MLQALRSPTGRILVLTLVHFGVDFFGGIIIPLPEPTLTHHLGVDLATVTFLLGASALLVNVVQPVSGWLLPKRGVPGLLILCPLLAAVVCALGLGRTVPYAAVLLFISAMGIGLVHPEAALAAHSLSGARKGLGMSIFMSGGYLGFSGGSLVSGWLVETGGLGPFVLLGLIAPVVALLVFLSGLHRLAGHAEDESGEAEAGLPFAAVLVLAISIAANVCLLVRLLPILLVRLFPGEAPQAWAGTAVFVTGLTGALGAFFWGHLSERVGRGRCILLAQLAAMPFLYGLLHVGAARHAPLWGIGIGLTMGAVFPLTAVLAREAGGLSKRLRMGLAIGGAWGTGEILFMLAGVYVDAGPPKSAAPVRDVYQACWVLLGVTALLAVRVARKERALSAEVPAAGDR